MEHVLRSANEERHYRAANVMLSKEGAAYRFIGDTLVPMDYQNQMAAMASGSLGKRSVQRPHPINRLKRLKCNLSALALVPNVRKPYRMSVGEKASVRKH